MSTHSNTLPAVPKKGPLASVLAFSLFVVWASLKPSGGGVSIKHFDKILHLGVYGLLALLAFWAWPKANKWKLWLGVSFYGGMMELCQGLLTQGRTPSIADGIANASGAAIALLFCYYWLSRYFPKA